MDHSLSDVYRIKACSNQPLSVVLVVMVYRLYSGMAVLKDAEASCFGSTDMEWLVRLATHAWAKRRA